MANSQILNHDLYRRNRNFDKATPQNFLQGAKRLLPLGKTQARTQNPRENDAVKNHSLIFFRYLPNVVQKLDLGNVKAHFLMPGAVLQGKYDRKPCRNPN